MKIGTLMNAAAVMALGLGASTAVSYAQGPLYDRVDVNLPYTVNVGNKTLQPGDYVIQQLRSASGDSRVLLIYSDNGMKFETSAMTIPALDPNTARDTKVILHHFGNNYYFDKIWIQGKDYGYEFPVPDSVKAREKEEMQPVSVAATYSSVPATNAETTATNTQTTPPAATTQTTNQAATNQQTSPAMNQQTTAATNQQTTAATNQQTSPAMNRQTTPATNQQTSPAMNQQTSAATNQQTNPATNQQTSPTINQYSANREQEPATNPRSMPRTSAGWLMMLLSGGALSGVGMTLRRKR